MCSNLNSTLVDEENCTLISPSGLETDFDSWLQNNGVDCIVGDTVQIKMPPLQEELLLDEIEKISQYSLVCDEEPTIKHEVKKPTILRSVNKTDGKRKHHQPNKSTKIVKHELKSDILLAKSPVMIDMKYKGDVCIIHIKESSGNSIFVPQEVQIIPNQLAVDNEQEVCGCLFMDILKDNSILLPQINTNKAVKVILCPIRDCHKAFFQSGKARLHALTHLGIKPFKCDIDNCSWQFYTKFKLDRHKETHSKKKTFRCDFIGCKKIFTTIYNLNNHKKSHVKLANLPCPVKTCCQSFRNEKERKSHCKTTHNRSEAPYRCSEADCTKSFFTPTALQTHARSHSHKDDKRCIDCGRVFSTPYRLREHARSHNGQRPYKCTYENCSWSFTTASKLRRHQNTHTNERKFHCTIGNCSKSFMRSEHLREHTLTHIGQRLFPPAACPSIILDKSSPTNADIASLKKTENENVQPGTMYEDKPSADALLQQAIQSLEVPSEMMVLGTGLLPEEPLELLENKYFSTVNLRDLD